MLVELVRNPCPPLDQWKQNNGDTMERVTSFLEQAYVSETRTWLELFGTAPPRKTVVRLCSKIGARLHGTGRFWGYRRKKEMKQEIRRLQAWYSRRKRVKRLRKGRLLLGRRRAMTWKVQQHLKRMRRGRTIQGLWNWRKAAEWTRRANLDPLSGTLPVERFWSVLRGYLPESARRFTTNYLRLICQMAFCRYNWSLYNAQQLSTYSEKDSMFEQKLHVCHEILSRMQSGCMPKHLQTLVESFEK